MDHWEAIAEERLALAAQLDGLTPAQWEVQSLCDAWSVRDVLAHLVAPLTGMVALRAGLALALSGGSFHRANRIMTAREARRPTADLVADLRRRAGSHFAPPGMGSVAPLTDILVHGCDIRLPLGMADERPAERWRPVLDFLVSPKARRGFLPARLPAVRFEATDLEWAHGTGDVASGPASRLALAILGRPAGAEALAGPGTARLPTGAQRRPQERPR